MAQITSDFNAETTNKQLVCFAFFRFTISSVKTTADIVTSLILALSDEFKFHTFLSDDGVRLWRRACESTVPICLQNWWCFYNCMGQVNVLWVVSAALHKSVINKKNRYVTLLLAHLKFMDSMSPNKDGNSNVNTSISHFHLRRHSAFIGHATIFYKRLKFIKSFY